jgi:hypothetical protein
MWSISALIHLSWDLPEISAAVADVLSLSSVLPPFWFHEQTIHLLSYVLRSSRISGVSEWCAAFAFFLQVSGLRHRIGQIFCSSP